MFCFSIVNPEFCHAPITPLVLCIVKFQFFATWTPREIIFERNVHIWKNYYEFRFDIHIITKTVPTQIISNDYCLLQELSELWRKTLHGDHTLLIFYNIMIHNLKRYKCKRGSLTVTWLPRRNLHYVHSLRNNLT